MDLGGFEVRTCFDSCIIFFELIGGELQKERLHHSCAQWLYTVPGMNEWITFASKELRKQRKYSALHLQSLFVCSFQVNTKNWETAHAQVMCMECSLQYLEYLGMRLYPGHMWQSWVEIEHYSVAYFKHVTTFKVLQCVTSNKGEVNMQCVNISRIHEFMQCV